MTSDQAGSPQINSVEDRKDAPAPRLRAQRLPAAQRRAVILQEASIFFAREGFSASTRDLADRLGVRQALLYKYFPSKEALLEAIFEQVFASQWAMAWSSVLSDTAQSLEDRVTTFYLRHIEDEDGIGLRLFLRAALDGWSLPLRMTDLLIDKLVRPLIGEMRRNAKLPDYAATPLMVGEFELVMSLHASVIFYSIRAHIYGTEMPADAPSVVRLYVNAFLSGAASSMAALHGPGAPADLKLPAGAVKAKV